MTRYAIKVVPPEWRESMPLPFNKTTHDYTRIEQGTRVLIYREGDGIVGEGEVRGRFFRPDEWNGKLPRSLQAADYLLPVVIINRLPQITPDKVRDTLDDRWFPSGDCWRPIAADLYDEFAD